MSPSDAELVKQALAGSQVAYQTLVARYATPAVNLVTRIVGDRTLAEDLAQDAFIRAFQRLASFDTQRKFSSWFFQVVHNVTVDHLRRRRVDTVSMTQVGAADRLESQAAAPGPLPDEQAEQAALTGALSQAFTGLRAEYREVIVLRYQEGLSDRDIGEIMDLPVGTVKTYLFRARKELAAMLAARGWGSSPK